MLGTEFYEITTALVAGNSIIEYVHNPNGTPAYALLDLLNAVVQSIAPSVANVDQIVPNVLFCCTHLLGCQTDDTTIISGAKTIAESLSPGEGIGDTSISQLNALDLNFKVVFALVTSELKGMHCWTYGDPGLFAFDALLRNSHGTIVGENFSSIGSILEAHLSNGSGCLTETNQLRFQTKLFFMALLESIVSDQMLPKYQLDSFVAFDSCEDCV
jgi:hypothetical protein